MRLFVTRYLHRTLLFSVLILLCGCTHVDNRNPSEIMKEYLDRVASFGFSGTVYFQKGKKILLNEQVGFQNIESQVRNSDSSLFYIASVSKSFTAAAILKLQEIGNLSLTDSISSFFPDCPIQVHGITIHDLLTHTSRIQSFGWNTTVDDWKIMSKSESVKGILNAPLSKEKKFNYNNANYILLAAIVENITGLSFQSFIQQEFLYPLGMHHTFFGLASNSIQLTNLTLSYEDQENLGSYLDYDKSWLRVGGGDIITTAHDLNRWVRGLYHGQILSEESVSRIFTIQTALSKNFGYGYGWYIRIFPETNRQVFLHTGEFKGYSSEVRYYPESDISLVVLSNYNLIPNGTEIISNDLLNISNGSSITVPDINNDIEISSDQLGTYHLDTQSYFTLSKSPPGLKADLYGQNAFQLHPSLQSDSICHYLNTITKTTLLTIKKNVPLAFQSNLPPEDLKYLAEYVQEWKEFTGNQPYDFTVNHTLRLQGDIYRTYCTLDINGIKKYYGFTWQKGKLIGTAPHQKFSIPAMKLYPSQDGHLIYYDWSRRSPQIWKFVYNDSIVTNLEISWGEGSLVATKNQ